MGPGDEAKLLQPMTLYNIPSTNIEHRCVGLEVSLYTVAKHGLIKDTGSDLV